MTPKIKRHAAHVHDELERRRVGRRQVRVDELRPGDGCRAGQGQDLDLVAPLPHARLRQGHVLPDREPAVSEAGRQISPREDANLSNTTRLRSD